MNKDIPTSLIVVAWLFIIGGTHSLIEMLYSLTTNHININFSVINIFAGIGLLKLRSGWRTYSLVVTWLVLIISPLALLWLLAKASPLDLHLFGQKVDSISTSSVLIFYSIIYAIEIWKYRVLIRPDIKELFTGKVSKSVYPKVPDDSEPVDLESFQSSWNPYTGSNWFKPGESFNPLPIKKPNTEDI